MDQETQMNGNCAREAEEMREHLVSSLKKMWLMGYDRGYSDGKQAGRAEAKREAVANASKDVFRVGDILERPDCLLGGTFRAIVTRIEGGNITLLYSDGSSSRTKNDDHLWVKIGEASVQEMLHALKCI